MLIPRQLSGVFFFVHSTLLSPPEEHIYSALSTKFLGSGKEPTIMVQNTTSTNIEASEHQRIPCKRWSPMNPHQPSQILVANSTPNTPWFMFTRWICKIPDDLRNLDQIRDGFTIAQQWLTKKDIEFFRGKVTAAFYPPPYRKGIPTNRWIVASSQEH